MFLCFLAVLSSSRDATCYLIDGKPSLVEGVLDKLGGVSWATFNDTISTSGWYNLEIDTHSFYSMENQSVCAGYLEGYLTQERIYQRFMLLKDTIKVFRPDRMKWYWIQWIEENIQYTRDLAANSDRYSNIMAQFDGLLMGYAKSVHDFRPEQEISEVEMWILQSTPDLFDLLLTWEKLIEPVTLPHIQGTSFIFVDKNRSDILIGHSTGTDYRNLHGVLKDITFRFDSHHISRLSFSTRIGSLFSEDSFVLSSNGLSIIRTSNPVYNVESYQNLPSNGLLSWVRSYDATLYSNNVVEWFNSFNTTNSGSGNGQFIVIDAKIFTPRKDLKQGTVLVIEQIPQLIKSVDISNILNDKSFFAGVNAPYIQEIYEGSGNEYKSAHSYPIEDLYLYQGSPRYKLLEQLSKEDVNFLSIHKLLRENHCYTDPLSKMDAGQAILPRLDRRLQTCKYGVATSFGGTDTKVTSAIRLLSNMTFDAIASPEYETNPSWEFGIGDFAKIKYDGLPKVWNFNWTTVTPSQYQRCRFIYNKDTCIHTSGCGWCIPSDSCLSGYEKGPVDGSVCEAGWTVFTETPKYAAPLIITVTSIVFLLVCAIFVIHFFNAKNTEKSIF